MDRIMVLGRCVVGAALLTLVAAAEGATGGPLPPPVHVRPEPEGITLIDPAFEPLPGAHADFGRLGGSVYKIELPARWNGRLVLYMEGYGELRAIGQAQVAAPLIRRYLIGRGFAWGASSFSSTSLIPGRAADETAALWDLFARRYGPPRRTYVSGLQMGAAAAHIAAERYGNRFDGALSECGSAGQSQTIESLVDFFVAGGYAAGVTQREFDRSRSVHTLIHQRILPALRRPRPRRRFEHVLISLTGGPRPFARAGLRQEEETNWQRAELLIGAGLASNRGTVYRLAPPSPVTSRAFNRAVVRIRANRPALRDFLRGNEITGRLRMPLLTLHTTGDGQTPIENARVLRRRADAAGRGRLLVQRVLRDPERCGFTSTEWEAGLEALVRWVERGVRPVGNDLAVRPLTRLRRRFELNPRPGTPEADRVPGARRRVTLHGGLRLDGGPLAAPFLGAVVLRRDGLVTPCQLVLSPVRGGRYSVTVMADREARGCGARGARIALWTFAGDRILYSTNRRRWPRPGRGRFDASFSSARPAGAVPPRAQFSGQVFRTDGRQLRGGTRVEAYVGATRCGVTSVRRVGSFSGFSLDVVGPDSVPGCTRGATLTLRVNGRPALDTAVNDPQRSGRLDLTVP
jgi:hypothetical protein